MDNELYEVEIDWLTVTDVAVRLNISYQTAIRLIHDGKLKAVRVGGQWRVTSDELERFRLEGNYRKKPISKEQPNQQEDKNEEG